MLTKKYNKLQFVARVVDAYASSFNIYIIFTSFVNFK